ncbi:MAG: helix-turn-helix domain-containing protein, partial [candidate division WOR-3 bacterium]
MVEPTKLYQKAGRKIMILGDVKRGLITLKHASELLNISYRHAKRLYKRFKNTGVMGLLPKKRTKPPHNKTPEEIKLKIINLKIQFPEINCCHIKDL